MHIRKLFFVTLIGLFLSACGLGGGNNVNVEVFEISGSSPDLEEGHVSIDSAINDGLFRLTWKVDDDGAIGYTANFYLSVNNDLSHSDIHFASKVCSNHLDCDDDETNH
jgi:hypothetical protein